MKARWLIGTFVLLALVVLSLTLQVLPSLMSPDLRYADFFRHCQYIILISAALCVFRIIKGPTAPDRVAAIDILGILIVGICALLGVPTGRGWYIDIGIAWALQSFIGTLALAKYLERKRLDE
jgi:multicomponent Na+:H+ antiporter subunit F